jgi:hypothetical protein
MSNDMEQSHSWEADNRSAGQAIPGLSWNPKLCHCVQKSPPLDPILSQFNPLNILTPSFLKMHFNVILPSTPISPKLFSSLQVFRLKLCMNFSSPHASCMSTISSSLINHPNNIWWSVQINKTSLSSFLPNHITYSLFGPDILLSTLLSTPFSLSVFFPWGETPSYKFDTGVVHCS